MSAHKVKRKKVKKSQDKKKKDFKWKIFLYIAGALLFLFLLYRIIVLISFKVDCSNIPTNILSNDSSLVNTFFVFEEEGKVVNMELVTYSQDQKNLLRINIPTNVYVTEDSVDDFPISSMKSVGEFLEHGSGREYTVEYMSSLLGMKMDNYVWIVNSSSTLDEFRSKLSIMSILFDFRYSRELRDNVYSNLPILNLIKEINFINQAITNYQYEEMDISDCCVENITISTNHQESLFKVSSFDDELSKYIDELVSKDVEKERVNVEVYNGSNISGLASEYARKIRHTGCRILRYDNAPNTYDKTVIYIPDLDDYKNSLSLVKDVVGGDVEIKYERPTFITTGDIIVLLGTDIAE
ncbi:MAG: LytR C-terminal domain-containing protein [Candidatus Dojkabacteria bacterium]|nr:LytR C-terminal domain-containing protein [Candidatus Dojkabacteria bacterium]